MLLPAWCSNNNGFGIQSTCDNGAVVPADATLAAIQTYAISLANVDLSGGSLISEFGEIRWKMDADDVLRHRPVKRIMATGLFDALRDSSPDLWKETHDAVTADARFAEWEMGMIGSDMGFSQFEARQLIDSLVGTQIDPTGEVAVDSELLEVRFAEVTANVTQATITCTLVIPLPNVVLPDDESFTLTDAVEFVPLSVEELEISADVGILKPMFPGQGVITGRRNGCRVSIEVPVVRTHPGDIPAIAPAALPITQFGERHWWATDQIVEDVLFVLRLGTESETTAGGAVLISSGWSRGSKSWNTRLTRPYATGDTNLGLEARERIKQLWHALTHSITPKPIPRIAIRRFNSAVDRSSLEDAVVDLMIVAESLFLSDQNSDRSELGFRLRLRCARLLAGAGIDPDRTAAILQRGYDLRSKIVHGSGLPQQVNLQGEQKTIAEFVTVLSDRVRDALTLSVELHAANADFASTAYWDNLCLH